MRRVVLAYVAVALTASGLYAATVGHGFVWDDHSLIADNRYLEDWTALAANLGSDFFRRSGEDGLIGYWRPIVTLSYMIDSRLFGGEPWGFHLVNVLLHAAVSCLVLSLAKALELSLRVSVVAALLFAVHPSHVEPVAWISGRSDLFCALFVLAALLLECAHGQSRRPWKRAAAIAASALALLSKETALIVPLLVGVRSLLLPGPAEEAEGRLRSALRSGVLHGMVVVGYVFVRFGLLGVAIGEAPAGRIDRTALFWTWWSAFADYARVLVWPRTLTVVPSVGLEVSPLSPRVLIGAGLFLAAAAGCWIGRRAAPAFSFALALCLIGFLPLCNFVVPISSPVTTPFPWAERFLYLPSVGFCLAAAWLLFVGLPAAIGGAGASRGQRTPAWPIGISAAILVLSSARTYVRAAEWRDDGSLFAAALRDSPDSAAAHLNIGFALAETGAYGDAKAEYRKALAMAPNNYKARYGLANALRVEGDLAGAEAEYRAALRLKPDHARSRLNLGLVLQQKGRLEEALLEMSRADAALPLFAEAKVDRANVLVLLGRHQEAIPLYEAALAIEPDMAAAQVGLAGAYLGTGREREGEEMLRKLVAARPDFFAAHLLLAIHLDRTGREEAAEEEYREALRLDPKNEGIRTRLSRAD